MKSFKPDEIAGLHVVTTDLPIENDTRVTTTREGQVPSWLNLNPSCLPAIQFHHHWQLFKVRGRQTSERIARIWRETVLPTFNSIGIETQIPTLAPNLTETILYVSLTLIFYIKRAHILQI